MLDHIIGFKPRVGLEDSNLFTELDDKIIEGITGGQQGPNVFFKCALDRFVIDYDGYYWYRGTRGCTLVGRNEAPEEVRQAAQG